MERKADTDEKREYWDFIDKTAKRVETYPEWKRGGSTATVDDTEHPELQCSPGEEQPILS